MSHPRHISISDYDYPLPEDRIAQFPLAQRDASRLLVMRDGAIAQDVFRNVADWLPPESLIVFNETRVIHARLLFRKLTGARIEVFCLEPYSPADIQLAFQQQGSCTWKCFAGNAKRWKEEILSIETCVNNEIITLSAEKAGREGDTFTVKFSWTPENHTFSQVLETFGRIPLPPYIGRESEDDDNLRYQTVFARNEGSVAAPTAGLHFTEEVFRSLTNKNIATGKVTLHVGAGTFKPVSSETISEHTMHSEKILVPLSLIKLLKYYSSRHITLTGTTTVRTLESVYWQGVKWMEDPSLPPVLHVKQWDPYAERTMLPSLVDSLETVTEKLEKAGMSELTGTTSLLIAPGYSYKVADAIITNFHQPRSTLLLLVAAFVGEEWKSAYDLALANHFRFLSYGDSCLFFRKP